jgi:[protein-PII] uridylyltransferase
MANELTHSLDEGMREVYQQTMLAIGAAFAAGASGPATLRKRSDAIDALVLHLWQVVLARHPGLAKGITLVAVGGYGRRELFPYSDVDLLFLLDSKLSDKVIEATIKDPVRRMSQSLWDCGLRISPVTRKLSECEKFDPENTEFALALLDQRFLCGDEQLYQRLDAQVLQKFFERERDAILRRLAEITVARHAKYGGTLFHLEPNIKDCPGGLRDVHVCGWVTRLLAAGKKPAEAAAEHPEPGLERNSEFHEAVAFLQQLRCFLHFRHERDDNTLDWQAQDAAAAAAVGLERLYPRDRAGRPSPDAAYWMRLYFRNARVIERKAVQMLEEAPLPVAATGRFARLAGLNNVLRQRKKTEMAIPGLRIDHGAVVFDPPAGLLHEVYAHPYDPAHDPETVLRMFEAMSRIGCRLGIEAEERLSQALPVLSGELEEGIVLWRHIEQILLGPYAGSALRAMHALGVLELLIPEFHGIDALVIRDAYHRYTVDEHSFVLIDTLHDLEAQPPLQASALQAVPLQAGPAPPRSNPTQPRARAEAAHPMDEWASRFGQLLRDLQQPGLLYLVALLHDTGKGRSTRDHAQESVRMAENVLVRLELDGYESNLVLRLIGCHLEMSAALRRDIFDTDTVRAFAAKVQTPEALRMLTLFTYADIQAVHPDALTSWKAENLWRLYLATSNYLDRNVDEERVGFLRENEQVLRVTAMLPARRSEIEAFLEGLPARYLSTRTPEQVRSHFLRSTQFAEDKVQIEFIYSPGVSEITLITPDRPLLFADMTGALAAWGMNILTADAFANRQGTVLDSFRFTDAFRTLEMNPPERDRFLDSIHDVITGKVAVETLLHGKRRGKRKAPMIATAARVDFDDVASAHSTLVQVVAQDTPGLLRALSLALAARECNIDVALVDTEGETAIDVFYVTKHQAKLSLQDEQELGAALLEAIEKHGR